MSETKYLIIAGTSKAGTTSLYNYLGAHPQIEPSIVKQTYFFLDIEWQKKMGLNSLYNYSEGLHLYNNFFKNREKKYFIESSPDYLYAPNTPNRIHKFLKNQEGKIILILRDPVWRFHSFFNFGKQEGLIPESMNFEQFYNNSKHYEADTNTCLMAHKTGYYTTYLSSYFNEFDREDIYVLFFENMKDNPRGFLKKLSYKLGIESSFYDAYNFEIRNKTEKVRNQTLRDIYLKLRAVYISTFYKNVIGIFIGKILKKTITKIYRRTNLKPLEKKNLESKIFIKLENDYKSEKELLKNLLGEEIPW